ncbi:hypothetical protein TrST_g4757 [Triparma strigata]|uniref:Uncharacterized protein n=1 Tax=Triparma strigata TaxID=1606541 RepID=A0A9W7AZP3_9STRA|nr:hypothetical protein TrST_g4757 [Triparma strigata]
MKKTWRNLTACVALASDSSTLRITALAVTTVRNRAWDALGLGRKSKTLALNIVNIKQNIDNVDCNFDFANIETTDALCECGVVTQGLFNDAFFAEERCFHDCEAEPDSCDNLQEMMRGSLSDCSEEELMIEISSAPYYPCDWMDGEDDDGGRPSTDDGGSRGDDDDGGRPSTDDGGRGGVGAG